MKVMELMKKYSEIIFYLIFGVLTTVINFVTYILATRVINFDIVLSTIIAWVISVLFAYVTNKLYVFNSKQENNAKLLKEFISFILARVFTGILDVAIMYIFVDVLEFNDIIMKILSNIIVIILNYILSKIVIFKK